MLLFATRIFFTETPSGSISIKTNTAASDVIQFYLVQGTQQRLIDSTNLTGNSNFSVPIVIPKSQTSGQYDLYATQSNFRLAFAPIQILVALGKIVPIIQGPSIISLGDPFVVTFENYLPQTIKVFLDSPTGTLIGTTTSSSTKTFTATCGAWTAVGLHKVYAVGSNPTQPEAQPISVLGLMPPK